MNPEFAMASFILGVAAYIDWKEHRVPNWLTFSALGCALGYHAVGAGLSGLGAALLGAGVGLATLVIPYLLRGMGAGDVKLMMAVGAWVGAAATLHAFLWIVIFGGLMGLYLMLASGQFRARAATAATAGRNVFLMRPLDEGADNAPTKILLPYGVPIAFGFWAYFLFGGLV